jgi:hypothetical protein
VPEMAARCAGWGCGGNRPRMETRARMLSAVLYAGAVFLRCVRTRPSTGRPGARRTVFLWESCSFSYWAPKLILIYLASSEFSVPKLILPWVWTRCTAKYHVGPLVKD